MFERFTQEARAIVVGAQDHARRLHHGYVGCEHILLALTYSTSSASALFAEAGATPARIEAGLSALLGPASRTDDKSALAALGIDLDAVRKAVEANFGPGSLDAAVPRRRRRFRSGRFRRRQRRGCGPLFGHLPFTPRAKRCLELSLREALRLKHNYIGVEHIALGLLRCDDTMAWRVLHHLGIEPADVRHAVTQSLRRSA